MVSSIRMSAPLAPQPDPCTMVKSSRSPCGYNIPYATCPTGGSDCAYNETSCVRFRLGHLPAAHFTSSEARPYRFVDDEIKGTNCLCIKTVRQLSETHRDAPNTPTEGRSDVGSKNLGRNACEQVREVQDVSSEYSTSCEISPTLRKADRSLFCIDHHCVLPLLQVPEVPQEFAAPFFVLPLFLLLTRSCPDSWLTSVSAPMSPSSLIRGCIASLNSTRRRAFDNASATK